MTKQLSVFFLAHLGEEMLLYRAIVMQHSHYPDLFYLQLAQVSNEEVILYFNQLCVPDSERVIQQQIVRF